MQLTPDRSASVIFNPSDSKQLTVTISGVKGINNDVEIHVEKRNSKIGGELGWDPVQMQK